MARCRGSIVELVFRGANDTAKRKKSANCEVGAFGVAREAVLG